MFYPVYVGAAIAKMKEDLRLADNKEYGELRERLLKSGCSPIEVEMGVLRTREVRALERRR